MKIFLLNSLVPVADIFKINRLQRPVKRNIFLVLGMMSEEHNQKWTPLKAQLDPVVLSDTLPILVEHYDFVPLDRIRPKASLEFFKKPRAAGTLDNGYQNNIELALPIFRKYQIQATLFPSTFYISNQRSFWFYRLDYVLQKASEEKFVVESNGFRFVSSKHTRDELRRSYKTFRAELKDHFLYDLAMNTEVKEIVPHLERVTAESINGVIQNDLWSRPTTRNTLKERQLDGSLSIGNHMVNHIQIGHVPSSHGKQELTNSADEITRHPGVALNSFVIQTENRFLLKGVGFTQGKETRAKLLLTWLR